MSRKHILLSLSPEVTRHRFPLRLLVAGAMGAAIGCNATLGTDRPGDSTETSQDEGAKTDTEKLGNSRESIEEACVRLNNDLEVGVTTMRRLSVLEFNQTIQSLFGGQLVDYSEGLPDDEPMGPFVSNQSLSVGALEARQYATVAEQVADRVLDDGTDFLGCSPPSEDETDCISEFISRTAPLAFRRPLESGEHESLLAIYELGRDGGESGPDVQRGLQLLLRGIIGSPDLFYITDTGVSGVPSSVPEAASAFTLASRLALAFWQAPPDSELVALARSGELLNDDVYSSQVERILNDSRTERGMVTFMRELTGVGDLLKKEKDPDLFPEYSEELAQAMLDEQAQFVRDVVFEQNGAYSQLLTQNLTAVPDELSGIYGANDGTYPSGQRQGILTQAAYLAAHNKESETSPVHLGIHIREALLCETIPPPPPNVDLTLPAAEGEIQTTRDRFLLHQTGPCKSCHELIDPIGLAFEHYDAIGRYRETDHGAPIDPRGNIFSIEDGSPGPEFDGALELSSQLADSPQMQDCVARQALRAALDRQESLLDACTTLGLIEGFDASGGNLKLLLSEVAHSYAFKSILLNPPEDSE